MPPTLGLKVTLMGELWPAARVSGRGTSTLKLPSARIARLTTTVEAELFISVSARTLLSPTVTVPKLRLAFFSDKTLCW